jgi:hypothetical protein
VVGERGAAGAAQEVPEGVDVGHPARDPQLPRAVGGCAVVPLPGEGAAGYRRTAAEVQEPVRLGLEPTHVGWAAEPEHAPTLATARAGVGPPTSAVSAGVGHNAEVDHSEQDQSRIVVVPAPGAPEHADDDRPGGSHAGGDLPAEPVQGEPEDDLDENVIGMVAQPAKVMRIGTMVKQLLDEVRSAPLDEAARTRLAAIHERSVHELEEGLSPELVAELHRIALPFSEDAPSDAELRIAQAQLVGWLEGLFHGIQTALVAQQMATQAQLSQMRRALPPGTGHGMHAMPGHEPEDGESRPSGPYL